MDSGKNSHLEVSPLVDNPSKENEEDLSPLNRRKSELIAFPINVNMKNSNTMRFEFPLSERNRKSVWKNIVNKYFNIVLTPEERHEIGRPKFRHLLMLGSNCIFIGVVTSVYFQSKLPNSLYKTILDKIYFIPALILLPIVGNYFFLYKQKQMYNKVSLKSK